MFSSHTHTVTMRKKRAEYTFFSRAHGTFSRKDHMLGHKTSLNKFKRTEIIQHMFSNNNGIKLEINNKEIWKILRYEEIEQCTHK